MHAELMRNTGLYVFILLYAATTLVILFCGYSIEAFLWFFGAGCAVFASLRAIGGSYRAAVPPAIAGVIGAVLRLTLVHHDIPEDFANLLDKKVTVIGTVAAIPDVRETTDKITVVLSAGNEHLRVLATVPRYPSIHAGDVVRLSGTIRKPEPFETDGGRIFRYDQFLEASGIRAVMPIAQAEPVGIRRTLWLRFLRLLESLKNILSRSLSTALPEPESALATGILVGGKQGLGAKLIDAFTTSGMLQIIVLSGFNVMIVASALMRVLKGFPKRLAFIISASSIASFVLMAGAGSSAVRAGLMAGFALAARTFGRTYDVLRIVFVTLFLIALWNPLTLAYDPGFQFSFIATLGLVLGTPLIAPRLLFLKSGTLIEMVATTLGAEIALLPLLLYETGNLSFVSVVANVLAMPVIPIAMALSAVAAALALPLGHVSPVVPLLLGIPAYVPLAYVIRIATLSASLPFAARSIPAFPFWIVAAVYGALSVLVRRLYSSALHRFVQEPAFNNAPIQVLKKSINV